MLVKQLICFFILVIFKVVSLEAEPKRHPLSIEKGLPHGEWIFAEKPSYKGPERLRSLANITILEKQKKYQACSESSLKQMATFSDLKGWIALMGMDCLKKSLEVKNIEDKRNVELVRLWMQKMDKEGMLFIKGAWSPRLLKSFIELITHEQSLRYKKWQDLDALITWMRHFDNKQKAQIFLKMAEQAEKQKGLTEAARFFINRANDANPAMVPVDSLNRLGGEREKVKKDINKSARHEDVLFERATNSFNLSQYLTGAELSLEQLSKFPGGFKADAAADLLIKKYLEILDRDALASTPLNEHYLNTLLKAHPSWTLDWARALHRRLEYKPLVKLAEKNLAFFENSKQESSLLYMLARAKHFLGDYDKAIDYADRLLLQHPSYSEVPEIKYRKGILFLRKKDYARALVEFEDLINSKEGKTYEAGARYYRIKILEMQKQLKSEEDQAFQRDFSLSYYGLKRNLELSKGLLKFDAEKNGPIKGEIWILPSEKIIWNRIQDLIHIGWFSYAHNELEQIPSPLTMEGRVLLAHYWAAAFHYPMAIRMLTEAYDFNPSFKNPELIQVGYPFPFKNQIEGESRKQMLNPVLIVSLIRQESAFFLEAQSQSLAQGLMQIIPGTAQEIATDLGVKGFKSEDIFIPEVNIRFGAYYIAKMIKKNKNHVPLGLAAYNAGPHRLDKFTQLRPDLFSVEKLQEGESPEEPFPDLWIEELPWNETRIYVLSILRNSLIYQMLMQKEVKIQGSIWSQLLL